MKNRIADRIFGRLTVASVVSLLLFPCAALAQGNAPLWLDGDVRNMQYPKDRYYSGFSEVAVSQGESQETALDRAKQRAVGELSDRVRVVVNIEKTQTDLSIQGSDMDELFRSKFITVVQTGSLTEVTGSKVDSWYDSRTRTAYAFAYVSRAQLASYYRAQVNTDLNRVETAIGVADELTAAGKKMSARRKIDEARTLLADVTFYRKLLTAADPQAEESSLQTRRSNDLTRTVERLLAQLEQSTLVYMECRHEFKNYRDDAFGSDPGILCDIIAQALTENECSITDNREEADYELTLITSTTQRSDGQGNNLLSYYANVKGSLYNRMTQKKTAEFSFLNDPDAYAVGRTPEDAATKAFKLPELKDKVMEKILPKIMNNE